MSGRPIRPKGWLYRPKRSSTHKVYEPTITSQLPTKCRQRTTVASRFTSCAREEQTHLGARAHRVAELLESRLRCRIDHGEALLERRVAQKEQAQGPGGPCRRSPAARLPQGLKTGDRLTAARLLRFHFRLDINTEAGRLRVYVQEAMEKEQRCGRAAILGFLRTVRKRGGDFRSCAPR